MPVSYAVIGASRGIGLEYVRQLAARADAIVFAVVRNKQRSAHLLATIANLNNVHVVEGDIVDYESMKRAAEEVASLNDGKLDYLIHNAAKTDHKTVFFGFYDYPSMDALDADLMDAFKVNTLGVIHSVTPFVPLLRAGPTKKIVVIGTGGGDPKSVLAVGIKNMLAYCATKAAAVMVATKWALELKDEGFVVVTLTPGLVDTSGTTGDAAAQENMEKAADDFKSVGSRVVLETPESSVRQQLQVIDGLKLEDNGRFLAHNGPSFV